MQQQILPGTLSREQLVEARHYSLPKNLDYMRLAFTSPRRLLEGFLLETSLLYGLVPFAITVIAYDLLYIWNYLQRPLAFARLLPIPEQPYYLYQALFAPLINISACTSPPQPHHKRP